MKRVHPQARPFRSHCSCAVRFRTIGLGLALPEDPQAQGARNARPAHDGATYDHPSCRSPSRHVVWRQAQRTSLAGALVLDPEVLFLDEPFAALSQPARRRLVRDLPNSCVCDGWQRSSSPTTSRRRRYCAALRHPGCGRNSSRRYQHCSAAAEASRVSRDRRDRRRDPTRVL